MSNGWSAALCVVLSAVVPAAWAADDAFCKDYSRAALNQRHAIERHRHCEHFIREQPERWTADYRAHYEWCRTVKREKAREERETRKREIERCERR